MEKVPNTEQDRNVGVDTVKQSLAGLPHDSIHVPTEELDNKRVCLDVVHAQ